MELASARSPQCDAVPTLLVPVGATEQHGPHLPLGTDSAIAAAVCARTGLPVAPAVAYGASGEQDRKSTRLNSSHSGESRMPSSA